MGQSDSAQSDSRRKPLISFAHRATGPLIKHQPGHVSAWSKSPARGCPGFSAATMPRPHASGLSDVAGNLASKQDRAISGKGRA